VEVNGMHKITGYIAMLTVCAGLAAADGLNETHPGFDRVDILKDNQKLLVGGLDTFSDGRLAVCTWGNPGEVWIVKGAEGNAPVATRYAMGLQQVLGCKVVDDTLYVMQMGELTQVVDVDKDGKADEYRTVNNAFSTSESLLAYAFDVLHYAGSFYAVLSSDVGFGGMDNKVALQDRSMFIRLGRDNSVENLAGGFRNPDGMGMGFGNRMFCTDNQGSWLPSSKIIYLEKGKFYGHKTEPANPFQSQPESPPLAWLPHGAVSQSPGNLVYVPEGIYKGQLLLAEEHEGIRRIYRVSVEEVGGVMQGAVLPFIGGLPTGIGRLAWGPGNTLYAGLLGANGSWSTYNTVKPGLTRLKAKDMGKSYAFEILAVRSTGTNTMELELTQPPMANFTTANFTAETWTFTPQIGYGAGNAVDKHALTIQSATLKPDGKTVVLTIGGLMEKYLVHFRFPGLKSAAGTSVWTPDAWFTLNKFGPGTLPSVAGCLDAKNPKYDPRATVNDPKLCASGSVSAFVPAMRGGGPMQWAGRQRVRISVPQGRSFELALHDFRGKITRRWNGSGSQEIALVPDHADRYQVSRGVFFLRLMVEGRTWTMPCIL
jgi:hypothetical protein